MAAWLLASITGGTPPPMMIPSFTQAFLGWLLGIAVLIGPIIYMVVSWSRRHGHWWSFFTQWRTLSFWFLLVGSIIAAIGMFSLVGMIPAWQTQWAAWHLGIVQQNPGANLSILDWNTTFQQQYAFMLQLGAAGLFLLGAAGIVIGQPRLARRMSQARPRGPDDWLVASPETGSLPAVSSSKHMKHPFSSQP